MTEDEAYKVHIQYLSLIHILHPFSRHPYKVRDDDAMRDMAESVKQYGVLSPAICLLYTSKCV